jgi:hypothetical protein
MARSSNLIYQSLERSLVNMAASVGLTINPSNWSKTDYKRLIMSVNSDGQSVQEQLYDSFRGDIETIASALSPQTPAWIQDKMINLFEYDAIAVPIVQLDTVNLVPYYINPNSKFRIVKYCSVVPGILGTTTVKIAADSSGAPSQIISPALDAAQTFVNTITFNGLIYNVVSLAADRLFLQLDVFYNGLYSAVIETNVINAIKAYLLEKSTKNFNGKILLSDLIVKLKAVIGVNDVVIVNSQARANTTTVGTGTNLILNKLELLSYWQTVSGYMIPEDTAGANWRLTDYRVGSSGLKNLNLIPQ